MTNANSHPLLPAVEQVPLHSSRLQWKRRFAQTLLSFGITHNTRPGLIELLIEGFLSWVDNRPIPPLYITNPDFQSLCDHQTTIGWDQIIKGRLSHEWSTLQREHLRSNPSPNSSLSPSPAAATWSRKLIRTLYNTWYDLWLQRNKSRHGRDYHEQQLRDREYSIRQAEQFYSQATHAPPHLQFIFRRPWEVFIQQSTTDIKAWYNLYSTWLAKELQQN